jgi:hypothetical protein
VKIGDFKLWRSPAVCWSLFIFFCVMSVVWQIVAVKPYPNEKRDWLVGTIILGGLALLFLVLGCRAKKQKKKPV